MAFLAPLLGPVVEVIGKTVDKIFPDASEAQRLKSEITLKLMEADWGQIQGQLQANIEEAKSDKLFVAGWRPCVGWCCAAALAYHYLIQPVILFALAVLHLPLPLDLPQFDMTTLMPLTLALLGIGTLRSYEKVKGAENIATGK